MPIPADKAKLLGERLAQGSLQDRAESLRPRDPKEYPLPPSISAGSEHSEQALRKRRVALNGQGIALDQLGGQGPESRPEDLEGNIEDFVGFARVPVGVLGPLRINGLHAHGDFYVPLATTEGALVASCNRGAHLVSHAGGTTALCLNEGVSRAPCFVFDSVIESAQFVSWLVSAQEMLQQAVQGTSHHCRLADVQPALIGKEAYVLFQFETGDAAGQNMVTLATDAICQAILREAPHKPVRWYLESNLSGDKKATMLSFVSSRGKTAVAEVLLPKRLVRRCLHTEPEEVLRYWSVSVLGGVQAGSIGIQGHFANALAGLFIACGQDAACVAEAAVGLTRVDVTAGGDLYISVKLPNLIVGTIGGGTHLPTARECLAMIGCYGEGKARKFAEVCAATVLAGEISLIGAIAAGDFSRAHAHYGRRKDQGGPPGR